MSLETTPLAARAQRWSAQLVQIAAIVAIVFLAKGAFAEPFYVPSASMEPTLLIGDALLASKFPYGYSAASLPIHIDVPETGRIFGATPKRGDVVVFRWPGDRAQVWVKRVIGLPGDRVQVRQGQVWINGRPASIKPDGIGEAEDDNGRLDNTPEVVVPPDRLFVMGDNRDNSADSRVSVRDGGVGLLPMDNLVGRVDAIVGSWDLGIRSRPITSWLEGFRVSRFFTSVH